MRGAAAARAEVPRGAVRLAWMNLEPHREGVVADPNAPEGVRTTSAATEALARELYWAASPIPEHGTAQLAGDPADLVRRWSELEAGLRRDSSLHLPPDEPFFRAGGSLKRWIKRTMFRAFRPLTRRYDRIDADLALLGIETSRELALARQDNVALTSQLQEMRSALQEFDSTLEARVSPPTLMTRQALPHLGDVVLELGAGADPHPRATIHHDRIIHSDWIDVAHDLTSFPWPWGDASADAVIAIDVFEHLKNVDVQTWLDECWRILKPTGLLIMRLPAWTNPVSYRDPTHYRVFHEESFSYWDPDHDLYELFGRYYFLESDRWWKVRRAFREFEDLRFDLEKRA